MFLNKEGLTILVALVTLTFSFRFTYPYILV